MPYLDKLGFTLAAYGCTTCIGNAGDLTPELNEAITKNDIVAAAVLSGNRNFEARIHPNIRANFLASPPLVVAYAIAGNITRDLMTEPVGKGKDGQRHLPGRHLADERGSRRAAQVRAERRRVPRELRAAHQGRRPVEQDRGRNRSGLRLAEVDLHRGAAVLRQGLLDDAGRQHPGRARTRARLAFSVTRSRPTTSARLARSRKTRRQACG